LPRAGHGPAGKRSPDVTILHDEADAQTGGKLAHLGARPIDSTSRKLVANVFENVAVAVASPSWLMQAKPDGSGPIAARRAQIRRLVSSCKQGQDASLNNEMSGATR
jgi:hypothetical protein